MLEAMARGVPVLAYARGSVPEVIDPGRTGFHGGSAEELASFVDAAAKLDRGALRAHARSRFSDDRMVDEYVSVYRGLTTLPPRAT